MPLMANRRGKSPGGGAAAKKLALDASGRTDDREGLNPHAAKTREISALIREDRIHSSIYYDAAIFELEMERIFEKSWVCIGHESEIRSPGDYKLGYLGRQPIIVARDSETGTINVMLNRCRHRGAAVCVEEFGNASYFRCAFHGWTYDNKGQLVGVPHPKGYPEGFPRESLGLTRVPRVETYRGFMFARLSEEGTSLPNYLGNMIPVLDEFVDQSPVGEIEVRSAQKYRFGGNWKWELENTVDAYHVAFLHHSFVKYLQRTASINISAQYAMDSPVRTMDMGGGHAAIHLNPPGGVASAAYDELLGFPYTAAIFPNLICIGVSIRLVRPISPTNTETTLYAVALKGVSDEVNEERMRSFELMDGRAGIITPDDGEVYERQRVGHQATANEWMYLARGLGMEEVDPETGIGRGDVTSELPIRGIYRKWAQMLAE